MSHAILEEPHHGLSHGLDPLQVGIYGLEGPYGRGGPSVEARCVDEHHGFHRALQCQKLRDRSPDVVSDHRDILDGQSIEELGDVPRLSGDREVGPNWLFARSVPQQVRDDDPHGGG